MEVPEIMGGTPDSCLLEDREERCSCTEEDMESERAALESRIR